MTKEFTPYGRALKLKELGFDESCFGFYYDDGELKIKEGNISRLGYINAPTFQQAFRWFREEHGVSVYVSPLEDSSAFYHMIYTNITVPYSNRICSLPSKWNTYEEAELACLDKLIEIVELKQEEQ